MESDVEVESLQISSRSRAIVERIAVQKRHVSPTVQIRNSYHKCDLVFVQPKSHSFWDSDRDLHSFRESLDYLRNTSDTSANGRISSRYDSFSLAWTLNPKP